jgi:hypothetical protein
MRIYRAAGVLTVEQADDISFLGTTVAFRDGAHYLTASHCVPPGIPVEPSPNSGLMVSLASGTGQRASWAASGLWPGIQRPISPS